MWKICSVAEMRSNRLFDTDAQRRPFASLRSSPPVAGQLRRWTSLAMRRHLLTFALFVPFTIAAAEEPAATTGTFCWPMHYAGIVAGVSQEKHVIRLLGQGVSKPIDSESGRFYVDPAGKITLSVQFVTDKIVGEIALGAGVSAVLSASERGQAVSKQLEPKEGWGKWHALNIGATREQVRENLGPPAKTEGKDVWTYESSCAGEIPQYFTVSFRQGKVWRVVFSAPAG